MWEVRRCVADHLGPFLVPIGGIVRDSDGILLRVEKECWPKLNGVNSYFADDAVRERWFGCWR